MGCCLFLEMKNPHFGVRRSYQRALMNHFSRYKAMNSFRDAAKHMCTLPNSIHLETEVVPLAHITDSKNIFLFRYKPLDSCIASVRAVKSEYELSLMRKSGKIHQHVLEDIVPNILCEGMNEATLASKLFSILIDEGHDAVTRFGMFDTEIIVGHVGFGESSLYPTYFDGASGNKGLSPAAPFWEAVTGIEEEILFS